MLGIVGTSMTITPSLKPTASRRPKQRGAAGIEFALLFTIFFAVFYATLSYAIVMLLYQGLTNAAAEGARAAIKVNSTSFTAANYQAAVSTVAKTAVENAIDWMPQVAKDAIKATGISSSYATTNVTVGSTTVAALSVTVTVKYPNFKNNAILPLIAFPFNLGTIPSVPDDLVGSATMQITPTAIPAVPAPKP
jgi:Flp pilus assembly protein TadG